MIIHNERELVELLKKGDHKAFEEIYNKYWEKLYSVAFSWTHCKETSKELVQDLFLKLWDKRENLEIYKSLNSYVYSFIKYLIYNHLDSKKVKEKHLTSIKSDQNFDYSTDQKLSFDELYGLLDVQINNLPEKTKNVFQLSRQQNLTNKEIAKKLDISEKTVEFHVTKSLKKIKTGIKDYLIAITFFASLF